MNLMSIGLEMALTPLKMEINSRVLILELMDKQQEIKRRVKRIVRVGECPLHGKQLCLCVFGPEGHIIGRVIKLNSKK
jgi:hypothetical protein